MTEDMGVRGARKNAQIQYEKFEARKTALLNRKSPNHRGLPVTQVSPLMAVKTDDVTTRLLKLETDAAKSRTMAHVTMAMTVGMVVGLAVMKTK
mmetsp:Transcript_346/g.643  ORF Transcript_346/g.643 Transcript_346/m.643 type:complete len:94 (-) Transcript_346:3767-4048(-)